MKNILKTLGLCIAGGFILQGCQQDEEADRISPEVIHQIEEMGFNPDGIVKIAEGYLIENDIIIRESDLGHDHVGIIANGKDTKKQYSTDFLVNAGSGRVITIYAPVEGSGGGGGGNGKGKKPGGGGGGDGYSPAMIAGLDEAIARYNAEGLSITFQRVTSSSGADIVMTRLNKRQERQGVLGSAGFPTASGDPYPEIKMSGVLESSYGLSTDGIATIIAHEMGHCIGFRHTDYFDRSISCGGATSNEGDGGVGANHIPGTPTGADLQGNGSWMLSCTDGSNRPFTNADKTALDYLY